MLFNKLIAKKRKLRKKGQISYSSRNYYNPFFVKKRRKTNWSLNFRFGWKSKLASFIALFLLITAFFFLFFSGYFNIKDIEISGEGRIPVLKVKKLIENKVNDKILGFIPQKNIFFFRTKDAQNELEKKYSFEAIAIKKKYPDRLLVDYTEKKYAFILEEGDKYYYADAYGYLIDEANLLEISAKAYPVIKNESGRAGSGKQAVFEENYISLCLEIFERLGEAGGGDLLVDRFIYDDEINSIKTKLKSGPKIYFSAEKGIEEQIGKLILVKNEKIKDQFKDKEYIDLRFSDSVYYK